MTRPVKNLIPFVVLLSAMCLAVLPYPAGAAGIECITPEELKNLIESRDPTILVVDTQPKGAYDLGHITGAINFPWAMDIKNPGTLPRDKTLIVYCDCGHEEALGNPILQLMDVAPICDSKDDSVDVAEQLMTKFGYTKIKVLAGGWSKWRQLGYPVAPPLPP